MSVFTTDSGDSPLSTQLAHFVSDSSQPTPDSSQLPKSNSY